MESLKDRDNLYCQMKASTQDNSNKEALMGLVNLSIMMVHILKGIGKTVLCMERENYSKLKIKLYLKAISN